MKNLVLVITSLFMLSLAACSNQNSILDDTQDNGKMQPESMITLADGVWPENEYTEGLPIPQGTVQ